MMTDTEIRLLGVRALTTALGEVNAEKFITLILREPFDYTEWQENLWDDRAIEDISRSAMTFRRSLAVGDSQTSVVSG